MLDITQLSPEGEVNSGGYIPLDAKRQGIYPPLFTDPEGDSCVISCIYGIVFTKSDDKKTLLQFLLLRLSRNDGPSFSPFAKQ